MVAANCVQSAGMVGKQIMLWDIYVQRKREGWCHPSPCCDNNRFCWFKQRMQIAPVARQMLHAKCLAEALQKNPQMMQLSAYRASQATVSSAQTLMSSSHIVCAGRKHMTFDRHTSSLDRCTLADVRWQMAKPKNNAGGRQSQTNTWGKRQDCVQRTDTDCQQSFQGHAVHRQYRKEPFPQLWPRPAGRYARSWGCL